MQHPTYICGYNGSIDDCAKELSNLKPMPFSIFLRTFADDFKRQSVGDEIRGYTMLSNKLELASLELYEASDQALSGQVNGSLNEIVGYKGNCFYLTQDIGRMRYDKVVEFLECLTGYIEPGTVKSNLEEVSSQLRTAWGISKPHM